MKRYTTSERLQQIMRSRNLKQVDVLRLCEPFCRKFGVKIGRNDMSQYVSGKVAPGQDKLSVLSMALGVSEVWLMGYDIDMPQPPDDERSFGNDIPQNENILPLPKTKKIPLLGNVACGEPLFAEQNIEGHFSAPEEFGADFCLRAKGDSMTNARIFDGDIVFVHQQPMVEDGEIAVILIDDEATIKRVYYDRENGFLTLVPENPQYKVMRFQGEKLNQIRILGKVIAGYYKI